MRDGSVMADSDLVDFLSGPTDSAINFNGSADLHTPIHPPHRLKKNCRHIKYWTEGPSEDPMLETVPATVVHTLILNR